MNKLDLGIALWATTLQFVKLKVRQLCPRREADAIVAGLSWFQAYFTYAMGKIKFNQYTWSLYIKNEYCEGRGEQHSKKAKAKLISHVYWVLWNCFVFYQTNCNLCDNTHIRYILRTARTKGVVFTFCQTVCNPCDNTYSISPCICLGSWEEQRQRMWCRSPPGGERESECDLIAICLLKWKSKDKRLLAFLSLNKSAEPDLRGD